MTHAALIHPREAEKAVSSCRKYNKSIKPVLGWKSLPGDSDADPRKYCFPLLLENHRLKGLDLCGKLGENVRLMMSFSYSGHREVNKL